MTDKYKPLKGLEKLSQKTTHFFLTNINMDEVSKNPTPNSEPSTLYV